MLINKNEKKNLNKKKIIYITVLTNGNFIFGTGIGTLFSSFQTSFQQQKKLVENNWKKTAQNIKKRLIFFSYRLYIPLWQHAANEAVKIDCL